MNARRASRRLAVAIATSVLALIGAGCGQPPRQAGVHPVAEAADDAIAASPVAAVSPDDARAVAATPRVDEGSVVAEAVAVTDPVATADGVAAPVASASELTAAVAPGCAAAGERVTVQVSGMPRASLALAVAFADDQAHGLMAFSEADDGGSFAWSVLIPPDAPAGEAAVLVGARDPADGRDIGTTTTFLVSDGGCR